MLLVGIFQVQGAVPPPHQSQYHSVSLVTPYHHHWQGRISANFQPQQVLKKCYLNCYILKISTGGLFKTFDWWVRYLCLGDWGSSVTHVSLSSLTLSMFTSRTQGQMTKL